ncbi:MAG: transposase [Rhodoferax sp.]|nr:transposase [Rhodoferax sp.]
MDRRKQRGADWLTAVEKATQSRCSQTSTRVNLVLTPRELINRIAQLVPPPRTHRRYYGVLAPNSPTHAAVTAKSAGCVGSEARGGQPRDRGGECRCRC